MGCAEGDVVFCVVCDAGDVVFCFVDFLHYETAVVSPQVVKHHGDFCLAWFDFEFKVAGFVCCTSVFTCEMTVVSYFWIVFCYFLFAYPTFGGFLIVFNVLLCHNQWFGLSKDVIDIANLTF